MTIQSTSPLYEQAKVRKSTYIVKLFCGDMFKFTNMAPLNDDEHGNWVRLFNATDGAKTSPTLEFMDICFDDVVWMVESDLIANEQSVSPKVNLPKPGVVKVEE